MNSLLKRQIKKFLTQELLESKDLNKFLEAVNQSYAYFEEQFVMQQRAMTISSEELQIANKQLREETQAQLKVIGKLKRVIDTLKFYELPQKAQADGLELDGLKLVEFIDNQTKEIVKINKQREKLVKDLAYQNEELSDYAHMVSHDLKSPLRSIDALTTWLKQDYQNKLDDEGKKLIDQIRGNVEKMEVLITGILEYSTIGKTELKQYDVDLNILIQNILDLLYVPENITVNIKNKLPIIKGDSYRLQQLFQNLIDNAVKYNDKPKGKVEIGALELKTHWQFYVKDNGKGIDESYFERIFKTFESLEKNTTSSGIGLSIAKKIIDLYQGRIWLQSIPNKGTTFYFSIKK
ncbi:ATP-binding protein [Tenacibaculum sp. UWU-22]|uniref:sensor histidine kinase n=1 Tax=Tenacibaculum sp. UWU-22 TaxID=3234187 RepID=UPI0034DB6C51